MKTKTLALALMLMLSSGGCAKKKNNALTLRELQNKKVAVSEVAAPTEAKKMVEIALVNEIIDQGRFEILDKATVEEAHVTYPAENDRARLGQKVGADYVLTLNVLEYNVKEREGYDGIEEKDSVLTEEARSNIPIIGKRYQKVKALDGLVRIEFTFFDVSKGEEILRATGVGHEVINSRDEKNYDLERTKERNKKGPYMGRLSLLERVSQAAVRNFFEKLPK